MSTQTLASPLMASRPRARVRLDSPTSATPDIGPAGIAQASEKGGPAFALSASEWLAIQVYVNNALVLPTTADALQKTLGAGAPSADFAPLVAAYVAINQHVTTWQNDTFPASVSLASAIYSYAQQAPTYYNPLVPLAQKLQVDPNDAQAKAQLEAILTVLSNDATANYNNAKDVAAKIEEFANQTNNDKLILGGTTGTGGLLGAYEQQFGNSSQQVIDIRKRLNEAQEALDAANAEYNHKVVVAATTPTYAWVWPFGTIAGAVVAGVYGKKATDALNEVHKQQQIINGLSATLAADALLMANLNAATKSIVGILTPMSAALPIIEKIQGVWGGIADDMDNLIKLINTNIAAVPPIIMSLGVAAALQAWVDVGVAANAYRVNAYISVTQQS